jgi:predicted transposase/invertase (TIGR01784 family)
LTALDNFIGSAFKIDQAVGPKEYRNRLLEIGPTLKKFDTRKFQLFVSWLKMVTDASGLPEAAKKELANILDGSKPEEAEQMVTNMEKIIGSMYEEGKNEGLIAGELKGKMDDAKKMLAENLSEDLIIKITGLPVEQIRKIKSELH